MSVKEGKQGGCLGMGTGMGKGNRSEAPAEVKGSAFFRVIAGADGEVSAVSPLYAEENTNLKALSRFLREEGQLHTEVGMPIEAFLYLRVDDAGVSYIAGSGSRLF